MVDRKSHQFISYLGSQDTFYVGTLKGLGRIYQQTFLDTCAATAFAKLCTTQQPLNAADLLNDQVLSPLLRPALAPVAAGADGSGNRVLQSG